MVGIQLTALHYVYLAFIAAVALIGAVLLPVAIRVGLPALGAAMAMNLFGHGIALSATILFRVLQN
ncbi:hypothetical protein FHR92_001115 [Fontibacillus solani]|uniref:Uncharacterized protein n=1 Tax=Fontibacillus solani TaxID=1572857 RepID=A0A7W3SRC3_9BACL|nr:hypothetical protein [Fontibacillus solani]